MEKRIKPLLPTLKEKKRYLAYEVISDGKINFDELAGSISAKSLELIGLYNYSDAGVQILKESWNPKTRRGIIRVSHKYVHQLKSGFCFINKNFIIHSIGLSGVINKMKKLTAG